MLVGKERYEGTLRTTNPLYLGYFDRSATGACTPCTVLAGAPAVNLSTYLHAGAGQAQLIS